jgi:hypothetical protein
LPPGDNPTNDDDDDDDNNNNNNNKSLKRTLTITYRHKQA